MGVFAKMHRMRQKLQHAPYKTCNWEHIPYGEAMRLIKKHYEDHKLAMASLVRGEVGFLDCLTRGQIRLKPDGRRTREQ